MKKYLVFLIITFLQFSNLPLLSAEDSVIPMVNPYEHRPGFAEVTFRDPDVRHLNSLAPNKVGDLYSATFPACALHTASNCVASLQYRSGNEPWKDATLTDYVQSAFDGQVDLISQNGTPQKINDFKEDPKSGTPGGGKAPTWEAIDAVHSGGNKYLTSVNYNSDGIFSIEIAPISWGPSYKTTVNSREVTYEKLNTFTFPENVEFKISVHLGLVKSRVNSWYFGRVKNPTFSLTDDLLTYSGSPVKVGSVVSDYLSCGHTLLEQAKSKYYFYESCNGPTVDLIQGRSNVEAFQLFENYLHQWKTETGWRVFSYISKNGNSLNNFDIQKYCKISEPIGFSNTNAVVMQNLTPIWKSTTKQLSYKIANPHQDETGNPVSGYLEIGINEKVAKCLWGASNLSGATAQIEITDSNGNHSVSVSTVSVKNGWILLNQEGFSFSSPMFSVSLQIPKSSISSKTSVVKTIQCIKGAVRKSISGSTPKCPSGFKKV